jgi:hypothetical protein
VATGGPTRRAADSATSTPPASQLGAGGDAFCAEPEASGACFPAEELAEHDGQERLDDDGGDDVSHGSLLKLSVKPTTSSSRLMPRPSPMTERPRAATSCPRLACLVIVIVIVVVEALVQHQEAKAADDHRDDNRDDIPADESQVDGVGQVSFGRPGEG